jgi:hypothetical protein
MVRAFQNRFYDGRKAIVRPIRVPGIVCILCFAATFAAGCSSSTAIAPSTILERAETSGLRDATFTVTYAVGVGDIANQFTGTGSETLSPARSQFDLTAKILSKTVTVLMVTNGGTTYTKLPNQPSWSATPNAQAPLGVDNASLLDLSQIQDVMRLPDATIDGHLAYHLRGTARDTTGAIGTKEWWLRQDNFYPLELSEHLSGTGVNGVSGDITLTFTAWNTKLSIALPGT